MQYENLIVEQSGGVARVTLNRPDAANGLNLALSTELLDVATRFAADPSVRVVLLTGAGARFCGGGDVKGFAEFGDDLGPKVRELTVALHAAIAQLGGLDAPVIAAVHGSVAGAGMGLVAGADLVLAAESTKFLLAYTAIGLTPDGGSSWFLPRVVGLRRALDLALTNRVLSAAEARDWGIVTEVVADDELAAAAEALATRLAAGPTRAFGATKRLMNSSFAHGLEEHLEIESDTMEQSGSSADGKEGVAAFVAKRPPEFTGT